MATNNGEYMRNYMRKYREKHGYKNSKNHSLSTKKWKNKNGDKVREQQRRYYNRNPNKCISRVRTFHNKLRDNNCKICNETEDLHFHHFDYSNDIGLTVCRKCHNWIHA